MPNETLEFLERIWAKRKDKGKRDSKSYCVCGYTIHFTSTAHEKVKTGSERGKLITVSLNDLSASGRRALTLSVRN